MCPATCELVNRHFLCFSFFLSWTQQPPQFTQLPQSTYSSPHPIHSLLFKLVLAIWWLLFLDFCCLSFGYLASDPGGTHAWIWVHVPVQLQCHSLAQSRKNQNKMKLMRDVWVLHSVPLSIWCPLCGYSCSQCGRVTFSHYKWYKIQVNWYTNLTIDKSSFITLYINGRQINFLATKLIFQGIKLTLG